MLFEGRAKITMFADCGWMNEMIIYFSVECKNRKQVEEQIKDDYWSVGDNWHFQSGCEHNCIITIHVEKILSCEEIIKKPA